MFFDSPVYFFFLVPVVLAYWRLTHRAQNGFLLLASYFFYGWWDWRFLGLMIASTIIDFFIAQKVVLGPSGVNRKAWLLASLVLNFTILGIFKYFNFFVDSFATAFGALGIQIPVPVLQVLLPPGISFYTFQEVAYVVDVYRGRLQPARSFLDFGLFVSLFPQLIAGPIERGERLLPQVQRSRTFDAARFFDGIMLIFSGLLRKCVIADNCALLADAAFGGQLGPPSLWIVLLGTYAFAWQVYGDFSGYSDIARGSARLLGFELMVNFRQPFLSQNIQEFWRRWHISLSTWLRDYLYFPMGGSTQGALKTCRNLLVTMVLAGLWHGAAWTYVVFGAIHGIVLATERFVFHLGKPEATFAPAGYWGHFASVWGQRILTFNVFCLSLAFFRAPSLSAAVEFLGGSSNLAWRTEYASAFLMLCIFAVPLFVVDLLVESSGKEYPFAEAPYAVRTGMAVAALIALAFLSGIKFNAFIYFQF